MQTFLSSSSSRPPHRLLGAQRPASPPSALLRGRRSRQRRRPHPALRAGRRREPMAEAGRRAAEPPGEPAEQAAAAAPEPQAAAPPPAPAQRWLPGDPSPRGRSQSDLSSCSSRGRPLRVHISGSGKAAPGAGGAGGGPVGAGGGGTRPARDAGGRGGAAVSAGEGATELPARSSCSAAGGWFLRPEMLQQGCGRCAGWARVSASWGAALWVSERGGAGQKETLIRRKGAAPSRWGPGPMQVLETLLTARAFEIKGSLWGWGVLVRGLRA